MKIRPVGAELFHADGRTYMTKLIVAFRNFANAPKKQTFRSFNAKNSDIQMYLKTKSHLWQLYKKTCAPTHWYGRAYW